MLKFLKTKNATNATLNQALIDALPHLLTFSFTFLVVGVFWVAHHRIYSFAKSVNSMLLWR